MSSVLWSDALLVFFLYGKFDIFFTFLRIFKEVQEKFAMVSGWNILLVNHSAPDLVLPFLKDQTPHFSDYLLIYELFWCVSDDITDLEKRILRTKKSSLIFFDNLKCRFLPGATFYVSYFSLQYLNTAGKTVQNSKNAEKLPKSFGFRKWPKIEHRVCVWNVLSWEGF